MTQDELTPYQWALPESLKVPADELQVRLDFYGDSVVLYSLDEGVIRTRMVSARDISMALLREVPLSSGLLPRDALWWKQGKEGLVIALWRAPRVWPTALQLEAFKPPRRFRLPMPGLIFICSPGRPPKVYAAKKRPKDAKQVIYHAPLFNVFGEWLRPAPALIGIRWTSARCRSLSSLPSLPGMLHTEEGRRNTLTTCWHSGRSWTGKPDIP